MWCPWAPGKPKGLNEVVNRPIVKIAQLTSETCTKKNSDSVFTHYHYYLLFILALLVHTYGHLLGNIIISSCFTLTTLIYLCSVTNLAFTVMFYSLFRSSSRNTDINQFVNFPFPKFYFYHFIMQTEN